ncbi:MAG: hypothetical protein WKF84_10050 [Pyrinomonadaceae bacterium]
MLDPHMSDAYYGRAAAYEKLENWKQAEADALAAIREKPKRKDAHQLLLRTYRKQKNSEKMQQYAAALEALAEEEAGEQALAREIRLSLRDAERLLREGKFAEAIPQYEKITKKLPTFYEAYFCPRRQLQPNEAERRLRSRLP